MAVGVPEADVFAAADAVLARGERPTVERVRLELGRGSPARVGGLLDQWWSRLAERLNGDKRLPQLPPEVAQAFVAIWQQSVTTAQVAADQSLDHQRHVLAIERSRVAEIEEIARLECARHRQHTQDAQALQQAAESRLVDLERLLEQQRLQIDDTAQQRESLKVERDVVQEQFNALHLQFRTLQDDFEQERKAQAKYVRGLEDRAHAEIDRAREETKAANLQIKRASKIADELKQKLQHATAQLSEAQRQLSVSNTIAENASTEIQHLHTELDSARADHDLTKQQVTASQARADTLAEQLHRLNQVARIKLPKSAVKRTSKANELDVG
ncbi:DNA-binding protein [Pseudomonas marincola]|uniref:DNA-binding protein n=1 Tax=Pseudomonas marincola TaxID=437900 RepID=UPI0008EA6BBF|nr:DNA-binding protein [Pseudomonas marincola]SFU14367.1 replication region DNA-binding N-term [Pseudomonas marincola]